MKLENPDYYINGVLSHNKLIIAKTITLIESSLKKHQEVASNVLKTLSSIKNNAFRIGITGVPGVGKSTFIEYLGLYLINKGHKVAVLAIDPSSTRTGGSIMADKTRMDGLSGNQNAYIRPSPSGGSLGGVASKTRETMLVCEAAGYDVIIIETVGVGQSETTVHQMVDFFLVLLLAGAGDEYQGIKKGIIELADSLVINKADGDNFFNAQTAKKNYENALHLINHSSSNWYPKVMTVSSLKKNGIENVWDTIVEHKNISINTGEFEAKRQKQAIKWMWSIIEEGLKRKFFENPSVKNILPNIKRDVENGVLPPTIAASNLIDLL